MKMKFIKKKILNLLPDFIIKYYRGLKFKNKNPTEVFTHIYNSRYWNKEGQSVSGSGSDPEAVKILMNEIPRLLTQYKVDNFLDLPCGDYNWMQSIISKFNSINYLGADIVKELIKDNNQKYSSDNVNFDVINLIEDEIPQMDLILCRDCLVHMSYSDILSSVKNIKKSKSKYLLTTSFIEHKRNMDIFTGNHRPLNLELPPFRFPKPLEYIKEKESGYKGHASDKCLGLWNVADLPDNFK